MLEKLPLFKTKKKKVLWEMPENEEVRQNDHM